MPELPLLNEILYSGKLSYGQYGKEFEKLLGEFIGNPYVIVTNSFNMAMLVTISTIGLKSGDTVIASPMACLASNQPLLTMGLNIKWADIDPKTGTLCPESVKKLIKYNPKAIFHNHFCGYVGYIEDINEIGEKYGIKVIDDGIEAFGSEYKNHKLGNTGTDVTVFSFNPVRLPNTLDGGAIVFKDKELFLKSQLVRDAGIDRAIFRDEYGEISSRCDIFLPGHSATPSEVNSYIGIQQMKHIKKLLAIQRNNSNAWKKVLGLYPDLKSLKINNGIPNYWVYGILANNKIETILEFRKRGFYASGVHMRNNIYSVFPDKSYLPGVEDFNNHFLALPCGWWVSKEEICMLYGKGN